MAAIIALLVAYLGISFNYAERLSRVARHEAGSEAAQIASIHEEVTFRTADGLTLKGWWFPAPDDRDRAVVLVHGKDQNRVDSSFGAARVAQWLLAEGYLALLFDMRGHGESEGLRWGLGEKEAFDSRSARRAAAVASPLDGRLDAPAPGDMTASVIRYDPDSHIWERRAVVVYDEFPMLRKLSPKLFDQIRAVLQRANTHATYVFMGSEVGVLEELFKSRRRMPFRLGTTIEMPTPTAQEWVDYIELRFRELGRRLSSGEAAQLVSFTGGHPRNLMEACQHLLTIRKLRDRADPEDVELSQARTLDGLRLHFEDIWNNLDEPRGAKTVAARIATGRNVYGRGGGLAPRQVKRALDKLEHEGLIRRVRRGGYEFSDALFGRFVREMSDRS